jgi:hypothetical protein
LTYWARPRASRRVFANFRVGRLEPFAEPVIDGIQKRRRRHGTLRDANSRATKTFYPALSMCDLIFSGVFERHPRLTLAIVEFALSWVPNVLIYGLNASRPSRRDTLPFKDGMLPSDFFHATSC